MSKNIFLQNIYGFTPAQKISSKFDQKWVNASQLKKTTFFYLLPLLTYCAVDRFTKRFLSDIDGSPHFSMEVYIVKAESKKKFAQMSLLPLVLALFFIPLLWLVGSRIRHFETLWREPWCDIFLKSRWYEDLKNNFPKCLTSKYTHTNTQIQFW